MAKKRATAAREELATADRRREVTRLYREGHSQPEIARRLGVNQSTVSRDLEAVRREWLASAAHDVGEVKARELAKLDQLEVEYWEAWRRSVGTHLKCTRTTTPAPTPRNPKRVAVEVTEVREDLAGDPRYLAGITACIERRCRILGLDAPKKVEAEVGIPLKVVAGIDLDKL